MVAPQGNPASLYGGFAGTETAREQRNWSQNPTVVDGGNSGCVIGIENFTGSPCVVDGFTLRNGSNGNGGGVWCEGPMTISHNIIKADTASEGYGGGIYCQSASGEVDSVAITDNVIVGNTSEQGGGIYATGNIPFIVNNTFAANTASYGSAYGGAIYLTGCPSATVSNNIVASNSSGVYIDTSGGAISLTAKNNDIWGNTSNNSGDIQSGSNGNISQNPLFVDSAGGDYHIFYNSPCRDAGCDSTGLTDILDIACLPRIVGPHIDIGAHETNLGWRYLLTLTGPSSCVPVGTNATVTASVFDAVANSAAAGVQVSISVQGGTIVSVNGVSVGAQTATGTTDSNGNVTILVSRSTWGMLTVTVMVPGSESLTKTVSACFV